jgi:hypothetical protein
MRKNILRSLFAFALCVVPAGQTGRYLVLIEMPLGAASRNYSWGVELLKGDVGLPASSVLKTHPFHPKSFIDRKWPSSVLTRNWLILAVIRPHHAAQDRRATTCSNGRRRLWGRVTHRTLAASSSYPSASRPTTPSSRPRSASRPRSTTRTSMPTARSAWTFFGTNGRPR